MAMTMKGKPPQNPAKPVEILSERPPTKMQSIAVPIRPTTSFVV
jgi:hypothetical protein